MADVTNNIVQRYLDNQFIKIETEGEIQFIQESVAEVKTLMNGNVSSMVSGTLIVLDPATKKDHLTDEVDRIISAKWTLFKNKNKAGKATTVIRAVLLEAIDQIVKEDVEMLATVWLTAVNMFPHSDLDKEGKMIKGWLDELGKKYLEEANIQWGIPNIQKGIIRAERIAKQIDKVISESFTGIEKYNAGQNYPEWKKEFTAGLSASFSTILARQFGVKELADAQNALNHRNQLLWLKESGFSFSLNKPYHSLGKKALLPLVIACDIGNLSGKFVPQSVHAFIENLVSLTNGNNPKIQLKAFFDEFIKSKELKQLVMVSASPDERCNLLQFLSLIAADESVLKSCERLTGLKDSTEFTYSQLASWLLNDFLSTKGHEEM
jgi:hypothetical protein